MDVARSIEFLNRYSNESLYLRENAIKKFTNGELDIRGWAEPEFMYILNTLCGYLEKDENYLEIGTFCGKSLSAALCKNRKNAIVIDDFGLQEGHIVESEFKRNISAVSLSERINHIREKAEDFSGILPKIGLFYYDGNHDNGHSYEGLKRYEKYLSDNAIVIVDDYNIGGPNKNGVFPGHKFCEFPVKTDMEKFLVDFNERYKKICITKYCNGAIFLSFKRPV